MIQRKQEIESIIDLNLSQSFEETDSWLWRRSHPNFASSSMTPVFKDGMSDEQFFSMTEQMILVIRNFASHGSGWIQETI